MADEVKRMDIKEFRAFGYLQEVNRRFFHPLGLALEVIVDDEDGSERLGGVWDYRDDPEGILFCEGEIDARKIANVAGEEAARFEGRVAAAGWWMQPLHDVDGMGRPNDAGS